MLQWIKRLLSGTEMNTGKVLEYVWHTDNIRSFLSYRNPKPLPPSSKFEFYKDMLKVWSMYRAFEPVEESAIRRETIWCNNSIRPCSALQNQRRWEEAGISTIGDICHDTEARLLSHVELSNKFQIHCTFLEALGLRMSIPAEWRGALTEEWQPDTKPLGLKIKFSNDPPEDIASLSAKKLYNRILLKNEHVGAAQARWSRGEEDIKIQTQQEWANITAIPYWSVRETKLQSFQYKVINRIIPCKTYLKRLRIAESDLCPFCQERDSVAHFLRTCARVEQFWSQVCTWFSKADNLYLDRLTTQEFLFGIPKECHRSAVINAILLYVRHYIHRQKLFYEGRLELIPWLGEFRVKLRVEKWISVRSGKSQTFEKWKTIYQHLG